MKVITLSNEKGGVGKTTLATHVAAGLAIRGARVLLIDADAQANATMSFGLEKEPGFYNLLGGKAKWRNILRNIPPEFYEMPNQQSEGYLLILPGNNQTAHIQSAVQDAYALYKRLNELKDAIDFVVIDTSPTPSLLHGAIYLATDAVLYPTLCETFSLQGLVETMQNVAGAPGKEIATLGIVPNMYRSKTVEHSENLTMLREKFGELVWTPITQSIVWSEATAMRRPVFALAPDNRAATEALSVVDHVQEAIENV